MISVKEKQLKGGNKAPDQGQGGKRQTSLRGDLQSRREKRRGA